MSAGKSNDIRFFSVVLKFVVLIVVSAWARKSCASACKSPQCNSSGRNGDPYP